MSGQKKVGFQIFNCYQQKTFRIQSDLDYHQDTTAELFENWFKNYILPNLTYNSAIVKKNVRYHGC